MELIKTKLTKKLKQEIYSIMFGIYRLNAKSAIGYGFTIDVEKNTIDRSKFLCSSELDDVKWEQLDGIAYYIQGTQQITEKLGGLPFQSCQHRVVSLDAQPSVGGGILVFVTGQLLVRKRVTQLYA